MINTIFIYGKSEDFIIKREYDCSIDFNTIHRLVSENSDISFIKHEQYEIVYKKFLEVTTVFVTTNENPMYTLNILNILMNAIERALDSLYLETVIYNFKDVLIIIDSCIVNGKVVCLDPLELSTSSYLTQCSQDVLKSE